MFGLQDSRSLSVWRRNCHSPIPAICGVPRLCIGMPKDLLNRFTGVAGLIWEDHLWVATPAW